MASRRLLILGLAIAAGVAALILVITNVGGCGEKLAMKGRDGLETITIRDSVFHLEVAADEATRMQGLMGRTSIPADGGMLFIFPDASPRSFWMKDCLIDMDLIFLDPFGRITAAHTMTTQPPRGPDETEFAYEWRMHELACQSVFPAQFAIEFRAGTLDRLNLRFNDKVPLDLPRLKAMAR